MGCPRDGIKVHLVVQLQFWSFWEYSYLFITITKLQECKRVKISEKIYYVDSFSQI